MLSSIIPFSKLSQSSRWINLPLLLVLQILPITVSFSAKPTSFVPSSRNRIRKQPLIKSRHPSIIHRHRSFLRSSSVEDDDNELISSNPYQSLPSSSSTLSSDTKLILGLNKYTHDTSLCCADAKTGKILYNLELERLSRTKHDGGPTSSLIRNCLDELNLELTNIEKIVVNNHHHRVLPFESSKTQMEWYEGLGVNEADASEENLLWDCTRKMELSHHMAHAYSACCQCPFEEGMIVVMDGMGETYRTMKRALSEEEKDERYYSDLEFEFTNVPKDIEEKAMNSVFDWREGESVYVFDKRDGELSVVPVFKRWIEERTPPTLYNHGFENMDSVGAVYSRASSHIFGDWNACGKVMGMAPWSVLHPSSSSSSSSSSDDASSNEFILKGTLYDENDMLKIDRSRMTGPPLHSKRIYDPVTGSPIPLYDFDETKTNPPDDIALQAIELASRVQSDLETVALDFVRHFRQLTNQTNVCLCGGVALNSVLNGRISRESGFRNVFIPPYPGDEGIAVGCCAFGLFGNKALSSQRQQNHPSSKNKIGVVWKSPLSPYLGPTYAESEIASVLDRYAPWLDVELIRNRNRRHELICREIESGSVVAMYRSRSESGPRALGHRSLLADPRKKGLVEFINARIKTRERFRPFAPSVLDEHASEWFDLGTTTDGKSPYMSLTANIRPDKVDRIPAVAHVDGSSRLQTVSSQDEPQYHDLIRTFFEMTGIPMLLNTSFNTLKGEPIVETPTDALRSFACSMNAIELLVMEDYVVRRKKADVRSLLGERKKKTKGGFVTPPSYPLRAGPVRFRTECTIRQSGDNEDLIATTMVRMPDRIMHDEKNNDGWFELLDEFEGEILGICDGTTTVEEMISEWHPEESDKFDQVLFENLMKRLTRLFEYTLISW